MLKKTVEYTNFYGKPSTATLYFNISQTDAQRMLMREMTFELDEKGEVDPKQVRNGMVSRIEGVMSRGKGREMLDLFDWLVKASYGVIGEDGEEFDNKDPKHYEKWRKSASYDAFFNALMTDTDLMVEFFNGIFPEGWNVNKDAKADPEFARHRAELGTRGIPTV